MMLVEIQQHALPVARELMSGTDAPVVVLDLSTEFRNHALDTDRTHIPSESRFFKLFDTLLMMRGGDFSATGIERSSLVRSDQTPDFLDKRWQCSLCIGRDSQIDFGIVSVVMNISSLRKILSADADGLSAVGSCVPRCGRHIVELEAESHIRSIPCSASAVKLVPVWKVLPRSVRADEHG